MAKSAEPLPHNTPSYWRILATRPVQQNDLWLAELSTLGYRTLDLPLLTIRPVSMAAQKEAVKHHILQLEQYSKILFVSQNAVKYGFEWINDYWPQFPQGVGCFAVGAKTLASIQATLNECYPDTQAQAAAPKLAAK